MGKKHFTEEQIAFALRQATSGTRFQGCKSRFSDAIHWRAGMTACQIFPGSFLLFDSLDDQRTLQGWSGFQPI
jgi:hypothetical protein